MAPNAGTIIVAEFVRIQGFPPPLRTLTSSATVTTRTTTVSYLTTSSVSIACPISHEIGYANIAVQNIVTRAEWHPWYQNRVCELILFGQPALLKGTTSATQPLILFSREKKELSAAGKTFYTAGGCHLAPKFGSLRISCRK